MTTLPEWCPPYSSVKVSPVTSEEVYCICKEPDSGELMVGCDGCDDWFHFKCIRVPKKYKDLVSSFYCPYCQAGITGKSVDRPWEDNPVPKTLWKRKCRMIECYKPCTENSKYCTTEHGEEYVRSMVSKVNIKGHENDKNEFLKKVIHSTGTVENFSKFGSLEFTQKDVNKELNIELYKQLFTNDVKLNQLGVQQQEINEISLPEIKAKANSLEAYLQWLKEINNKILGITEDLSEEEIHKSKKKSNRKKNSGPTKRICGFTSGYNQLPNTESFLARYDAKEMEIQGVCIRLRCIKHHDWANMLMIKNTQDTRTLETFHERLALLMSVRKEQLSIQFYERLLKQ